MTDFEELMRSPSSHFESPDEVVDYRGLDNTQKLRILEQWKNEIAQLQSATAENMPGPPREDLLRQVNDALARLAGSQAG